MLKSTANLLKNNCSKPQFNRKVGCKKYGINALNEKKTH